MFRASSRPSSGATTAVATSGLPSELGDSSAVGRGRAACGGSERISREVSIWDSHPSSVTNTWSCAYTSYIFLHVLWNSKRREQATITGTGWYKISYLNVRCCL